MAKTFEAVRKELRGLAEDVGVWLCVTASDDQKPGQKYEWERWDATIRINAEEIRLEINDATDGATLVKRAKAQLKAERKAKTEQKKITHQPKRITHQPIGKGTP